ncbi:hypothetical protein Hanom_Chr16g01475591 [Helianthus anomalus]
MVGIREPMGIRVLSRHSFVENLAQLLPLCNEDTIQITPDSGVIDLTGCDKASGLWMILTVLKIWVDARGEAIDGMILIRMAAALTIPGSVGTKGGPI